MNAKTLIFRGIPVSSGKFYGKCLKIISSNHLIIQTNIDTKQINPEVKKFTLALEKTKKKMEGFIKKKSNEISKDLKDILNAQMCMLDDPILVDGVISRIRNKKENAPHALFNIISEISERFEQLDDEYFRERAVDIRDIGKRIEDHLIERNNDYEIFASLKEDVILLAHEITPSQFLHMDKSRVKGIASELGGKTGHMAILAKNFEIPAVVGLKGIVEQFEDLEYILIDGDSGTLIKNPGIHQIKYYGSFVPFPRVLEKLDISLPITRDGKRIDLKVNLESYRDCKVALKYGADGVGLFRSEAIVIEHPNGDPSEEEQFQVYKSLAIGMEGKEVTIRTFDLGADKTINDDYEEKNPFLGNRGIRYCLTKKEWFQKQIRAILRASAFGNISIMLPMVASVDEVIRTKLLIENSKSDLRKRKTKIGDPKLGIMVETPAAALAIDLFCRECDFFSIGTNDLLQYCMAVDRNHSMLSNLYNPLNISFLRLLKKIIEDANKGNKRVSICGELGSDTNFTLFLLGLGLREFSVSLPFVRKVKKLIRAVSIEQAERLSRKVFALSEEEKYSEIESFLFNDHMQKII